MRAVFICSARYSGSTLLNLLLGSHPEAAALGEITQFPKNLAMDTTCTCGAPARRCTVWQQVVQRLKADPRWRHIDADPYVLHLGMIRAGNVVDTRQQTKPRMLYRKLLYGLAFAHFRWDLGSLSRFSEPLRAACENKLALFKIISEVLSTEVLVDSSKHYLEAVTLYKTAPSNVRIVLLVRDGRAVYYSGLKRGNSRQTALKEWRRTYARALPVLRRHVGDEHLIQIRYEELVRAPEGELVRLCDFLGIGYTPAMLDFRSKCHHMLNGNDMRLSRASEIRPDFTWRERLSVRDLGYFDTRAGALNRALGYG